MVKARFAPSPTGYLHVGNLRTALFNYLVARKSGGTFILRLDDTDSERCKPEYADAIMFDLEWLGLGWDRVERQSRRLDLYDDVAKRLETSGRLYECFESPDELALKRKLQLKLGKPPVYDRQALELSASERNRIREEVPGYWRFLLERERVSWSDGIQGEVSVDAGSVSDPVVVRADGQYLYTLASVADDLDMGISDVIRGADHITNTAVQVQMMCALDGETPRFAHHSLLTGARGEPLAKRLGALSIRDLREKGLEPISILCSLAFLGSSESPHSCHSIDQLVGEFDLAGFGPASTKFDAGDLMLLNARHVASQPYSAVSGRLKKMKIPDALAEEFWLATRQNIATTGEAAEWWAIFEDGVEPLIDERDREFIAVALRLLPDPPYGSHTWKEWTSRVGNETGRRGRRLYMPLRKALTGRSSGPEMAAIMPLLRRVRREFDAGSST